MNRLRDKDYLNKINKKELLKYGESVFSTQSDGELLLDDGPIGVIHQEFFANTAYLYGRELVLHYGMRKREGGPWDRFLEEDIIYFDENGQYYENVQDNSELKEKAEAVIEKAKEKFNYKYDYFKIIAFFKSLLGRKKFLGDSNPLTIEEIQERLDKIVEKEKKFMDNYNTEKSEDETIRDAKQQEPIQEKADGERVE